MSVQSEINRIKGKIAESYSTIRELGGETPSEETIDNLPETISNLSNTFKTEKTRFAILDSNNSPITSWNQVVEEFDKWNSYLLYLKNATFELSNGTSVSPPNGFYLWDGYTSVSLSFGPKPGTNGWTYYSVDQKYTITFTFYTDSNMMFKTIEIKDLTS